MGAGLKEVISLQGMDGGGCFVLLGAPYSCFYNFEKTRHQLPLLIHRKAIFNKKKEKPFESLTISANDIISSKENM